MLKKFQIVDKLQTSTNKRGQISTSIKMLKSKIYYIWSCALFLGVAQGISVNECEYIWYSLFRECSLKFYIENLFGFFFN